VLNEKSKQNKKQTNKQTKKTKQVLSHLKEMTRVLIQFKKKKKKCHVVKLIYFSQKSK
jgi:hypothetical protein